MSHLPRPRGVAGFLSLTVLAALCLSQEPSNPYSKSDMLEPAVLVQVMQSGKPPAVLFVGFPILYKGKHITHATDAGQGSKPEGIEAIKKAVAAYPKNADIVIYCGCCPMEKCPNIRPAFTALKAMGYSHIRVLNIPTNLHTDWVSKGYPSEGGA